MSFQFTKQQRKTLALICETINPSLQPELPDDAKAIFENHAGNYPVVDELEKRLAKKPKAQHAALAQLLRIINVPIACALVTQKIASVQFADFGSTCSSACPIGVTIDKEN